MSSSQVVPPQAPPGKGLAQGQLGLFGSTVMGLASTAPVYSLVATLGFVITAVGFQAPIALILAFIPMFFIAFAYRELNRAVPDCGTTFTWATKAFGPVGGLDGRLGSRDRRHHRAREPRTDRRHLLLAVRRRVHRQHGTRGVGLGHDAHRRDLHRRDGLRELSRGRDRREACRTSCWASSTSRWRCS